MPRIEPQGCGCPEVRCGTNALDENVYAEVFSLGEGEQMIFMVEISIFNYEDSRTLHEFFSSFSEAQARYNQIISNGGDYRAPSSGVQ